MKRRTNVLKEMEHTTIDAVTMPQKLLCTTFHNRQTRKCVGLLLRNISREYTIVCTIITHCYHAKRATDHPLGV
jgi:hypothetical protein